MKFVQLYKQVNECTPTHQLENILPQNMIFLNLKYSYSCINIKLSYHYIYYSSTHRKLFVISYTYINYQSMCSTLHTHTQFNIFLQIILLYIVFYMNVKISIFFVHALQVNLTGNEYIIFIFQSAPTYIRSRSHTYYLHI